MKKPKADSIYTPEYMYWSDYNDRKERLRIEALKRGEFAPYGYWKPTKPVKKRHIKEDIYDDVPHKDFVNFYRLEITCEQANESIAEHPDAAINLVIFDRWVNNRWILTYKNALKLPNNHFIRDINGRMCLFRNKHFYLIL